MPVITIAQSKGGAGKTTLALALASEFEALGGSVFMLDADRQNSLLNWHRDRLAAGRGGDSRIMVEDASQLRDADIGAAINKAREVAQLVIVDSEGTSNFKTAYAAMDSDFVVIPTRSSRLDLERTVETSEMLGKMCGGVPYRVLITQTGQVDDPANLVSLGQSDWSDECRAREDPAGMGFFSLAGRDTAVSSASATASFSLAISGPAWTGEADIDVLPFEGPRGTTISFTFDAIRDGHLDRAVKAAALHFPLQVTYNDEPLPRVDFLKGAHAVLEREGYRIGVYKNVNLDHVPTINFHGLTLRHKLPSIKEVHHTLWRVKVDIIDAPELVLVLPARKEIYRNPALDRLMEICNEAFFAAISQEPFLDSGKIRQV